VSIDHYENFPVASWLCPPPLRPAIAAIYHFARRADDLADEGDASIAQRQADLRAYRADLQVVASGGEPSARWRESVFLPLGQEIKRFNLPLQLLHDLLDAFEQDLVQQQYQDRDELLSYCRRSANPVGRLLLRLYGITDPVALQRSDAICSSLQLINFWQDMSRDLPGGRIYAPQADLSRHGLQSADLLRGQETPETRALMAELCDWAQQLMQQGAPLVHQIPGRAGWELRLVVQGGLRILAKIRAMQFATLQHRPAITPLDFPGMLLRATLMRPGRKAPQ
jgi:squalene synthase HpnC